MSKYGEGSATYDAVGGFDGLQKLVTDFYDIMSGFPRYKKIYEMHPASTPDSIDKLVCFLSGWMGGEALYLDKYGEISIPQAHSHLVINELERDLWLDCMNEALLKQNYPSLLVSYLMKQFAFPAERIRHVSSLIHKH